MTSAAVADCRFQCTPQALVRQPIGWIHTVDNWSIDGIAYLVSRERVLYATVENVVVLSFFPQFAGMSAQTN